MTLLRGSVVLITCFDDDDNDERKLENDIQFS